MVDWRRWGVGAAVLARLVTLGSTASAQAPAPETADDAALAGEDDPARPPPKGKGVVWGVIADATTKEPLFDANVTVVGTNKKALADVDGRYRLELAPGTYELRIWYELYKARRIQNVRVVAGQTQRIDAELETDKAAEEVVEVEAAPDRASAAAQLVIRRSAAHVGDAVGAQEIARTPDRNAADAARRVVGATLVGGKYVYVRGLGDRYTNSLLNGAPLPSPEPDRQAVPLDLFPALILSDVSIAKSFIPDMPGDFAGGSIAVNTRELPDSFRVQGTFSAGLNSQSTFADRLTYTGSRLDWLGVDGGARGLPAEVSDYKIVRLGPKPDGSLLTKDEITGYGRLLNTYMATATTTNLPNMSGNFVIGDTVRFGGTQELGYTAALTYGRKFTRRKDEIIRTYTVSTTDPGALLELNDYRAQTGLDQVAWGGLATVTYKPHRDHKIGLTGIYSRSADNEARVIEGYNEERQAEIRNARLRFITRALAFGQLSGEHTIRALGDATLGWNASLSLASAYEPDTRETVYVRDASSGAYSWDDGTLSGSHFFGDQAERSVGGGLDYTQPLIKGDVPMKLKLGGLVSFRARTFGSRRFRYVPRPGVSPETFRAPPEELFTADNIGTALELEEFTRANDAYDADFDVGAGYVMTDAWLTKWLRVIAGGRLEVARQSIDSFDPFSPDLERVTSELKTADLLPSLSVVVRTTESSNIRLSASRTVARPQLRELAPFVFTDYFGAREVLGNPELRRTSILNADARFELFPTGAEVLALSVFYKNFVDPIEQVILPTSRGVISYQNAEGATSAGVELEGRKSLGFVSGALSDLTVLANLTLIYSRVELDETQVGIQTNSVRALAGQSPYVINVGLDYSREESGTRARLLYNVLGPRISQVGSLGLPDMLEQPRHQVDAAIAQRLGEHVDLKLTVENLLDAPVRFTQGDDSVTNEFRAGTTVTLGATISN